ncbi:Cell cycle checkpoint protein RAD17 [Pleurostoma richardsiae]|uniref:Cell cycle checkpoint protein RAD17 n=1 Tax=Pleurostoma richardsiae TaxID=41990 RepID=A0AA38RPK5_9PEZI|nr:Cell cycle checkpoint protein RAD17 [Pleurostoma richardsiae]
MAPPAKRRKRNIVDASEDEEDEGPKPQATNNRNSLRNFLFSSPDSKSVSAAPSASPSPSRKTTRSSAFTQSSSNGSAASSSLASKTRQLARPAKSPSTSPEKKGKGQRKLFEEKGRSADLLTLFSKQAQRVKTEGVPNGIKKSDVPLPVDDIISDPISEEDEITVQKTVASSVVGKNAQKRFRESSQPATSSNATASQRFMRPARSANASVADDDLRPWSERFAPVSLEELAVHKKKVADVRKWLEDVMNGRMRQRLLILKGAAGTGKTTTVQLLAKDMGCEVLEWRNPTGSLGTTQGFQSASAQFEEFLGRGEKFGQLEFDEDTSAGHTKGNNSAAKAGASGDDVRRIILIEEFPNTFMRSGTALTSFRKTIMQYLTENTPSLSAFGRHSAQEPVTPVVMVISETLLTTTSASADSFTAHRLLGPEILRHPGTGVIEFNDIAPTLLAKALELVVQKEARKSGRRRTPGPQVLRRLGEIGDIRNAISSLEFLCLKGDDDGDWGSKITFTKTKKGSKDQALTKHEQESLELISQREASLGIFHAVGKVVYNKRDELPYPSGSDEALAEAMPSRLACLSRPKQSQVCVETLIDETGTDTSTFISALHENYILSCERTGPTDPQSSIDYVNGCIEHLSESDLLCPSWDNFFGGRGYGGGFGGRDQASHVLRQDEMAFQVAVRGLLFCLPSPVKRQSTSSGGGGGGRGGDAFKMFYPTSLKLWRTREELEGLVDMWSSKMLKGEDILPAAQQAPTALTSGASAFRKGKASSVGDWPTSRPELNYPPKRPPKPQEEEPPPLLSLGNAARSEMLLERLPYMAHIARRRKGSFFGAGIRDLEKVVSFHGIGAPQTEESSDEADDNGVPAAEAWATDKPTDESSPKKRRQSAVRMKIDRSDGSLVGSLQVQKLVLSDDDIEDD